MSVFVLDCHQQPLMPCSEKRARLLLARKRAVVHRVEPFCIRLKDRRVEESMVQPVVLKLDPGSKTTGIALARVESTDVGEMHHALHLAHLAHRGEDVKKHLDTRRGYRRRRRSTNLRYRASRFLNRRRKAGWLPPSIHSRIGNVLTWARRYQRWIPLTRIDVERVKFDTQLMQNAEVSGVEYQRGELAGWELRAYLLEKFGRRCVYCHATGRPFELDHVIPRSRGGSNRVSNLVLCCHECNVAKGNQTAAEFGHPKVEQQARHPLRDAAAVNATRFALVERLKPLGLPLSTWSGGRTRWNRDRFGMRKEHALDALCVGNLAGVQLPPMRILQMTALGRGRYGRTLVDGSGFPRGYLMRQKRVQGFQTGDLVQAKVPEIARGKSLATHGMRRGRVAVRATGSFRVGSVDGINARYCRVVQRADGYDMGLLPPQEPPPSHHQKEDLLPPHALSRMGIRRSNVMTKRPKAKKDETTGQYLPNGAAAKAGLNKSIQDAGWRTFTEMTSVKAAWAGRTVVFVNSDKTSQICSQCLKQGPHKDLSVRTHTCVHCGVVLDRDTNAACNVLQRAHEQLLGGTRPTPGA